MEVVRQAVYTRKLSIAWQPGKWMRLMVALQKINILLISNAGLFPQR